MSIDQLSTSTHTSRLHLARRIRSRFTEEVADPTHRLCDGLVGETTITPDFWSLARGCDAHVQRTHQTLAAREMLDLSRPTMQVFLVLTDLRHDLLYLGARCESDSLDVEAAAFTSARNSLRKLNALVDDLERVGNSR